LQQLAAVSKIKILLKETKMATMSKNSALILLGVVLLVQNIGLAYALPKTGQSDKTSVVYSEGTGSSFEAAKKHAFRSAIQEAVGVLSISEQSADGDILTKDQINEYSAGYIDDYEVLESSESADHMITVSMKVRVASSKIAQRMISRGDSTSQVQGELLLTKLQSQLDMRNSGDELLSEVLNSYPQNAFVLNQGHSEVKISPTRQPYLIIPYEITMSKFWISGLNEALTAVAASSHNCNNIALSVSNNQDQPGGAAIAQALCGGTEPDVRIFSGGGFFSTNASSYKFYDLQTLLMVDKHLLNSTKPHLQGTIALQIEFIADTSVFATNCALIPTNDMIGFNKSIHQIEHNSNLSKKYIRPVIDSSVISKRELIINIPDLSAISELTKVKLTIQPECH
jgi:hypothetical protein